MFALDGRCSIRVLFRTRPESAKVNQFKENGELPKFGETEK